MYSKVPKLSIKFCMFMNKILNFDHVIIKLPEKVSHKVLILV